MKIKTKLILSFLALGLVAIAIGILANLPIQARVARIGAYHAPALNQAHLIESGIKAAVEESFAYVVSGSEVERDEFLQWDETFDQEMQVFLDLIERMDLPPEQMALEEELLDRIGSGQQELVQAALVMFAEFEETGSVSKDSFEAYEEIIDVLIVDAERLLAIESAELDESNQLAMATLEMSETYMRASGFLLLLFAIALGLYISRLISRPMQELVAVSAEVGKGNLDVRATVTGSDEVGELAVSFNQMVADLKEKTASVDDLNREIAEREKAEQALMYEHDHLTAMMDALPDFLLEVDAEGKIHDFRAPNPEVLMSAPDTFLGLNVREIIPEEAVPVVVEALAEAAETGIHRGGTFLTNLANGERWMELSIAVRGQRHADARFVMLVRDVTDRRQAEEENLALERQVQHAQKLESLGVLAGGIAHDFNNLLTGILGQADLALDGLSPMSPVRGNLEEIEKASRRAADLANQMLAYSGKGRFVVKPIGIGELIEEMAYLLDVSISKKAVLKYDLADDLPTFDGDATQIRQIFMNLVTNASEAIGDKSGVITVSTGIMHCDRAYLEGVRGTEKDRQNEPLPEGNYVYFEVSDTGSGMDAETIDKVFDPFFTTKFTGRGLGMSAVLGIVRGHKGALRIYSEVGKGSTFKVLFPATESADADLASQEPSQDAEREWRGAGTVLIADDEESVINVGKQMLERMGFGVLTAADGLEALDLYREHHDEIVCILLDLTMPRMDGEEAFRAMRQIDPDVSVILCSGYNKQDATQRFVGKGLVGFIQKPYMMAELQEKLQEVIATPGSE